MTPEETAKIKSLKDRSEIFNHVVDHLRRQGKASKLTESCGDQICAYRGDGGAMCAVGALITDDEYQESLEGCGIHTLLKDGILPSSLHERLLPHEEMLADLQNFHDDKLSYKDGAFSKESEERLIKLRNECGIEQ
jgi:hypothetical protein